MDSHGKWIILVHGNLKIGQDHKLYRLTRNNLPLEYLFLAINLPGFGSYTRARRKASKGIGHRSNHCVRAAIPNYWSEIALSDHTYGIEFTRLPEPLKGIYSRLTQSLLMYRINGILSTVGN